ncbi:MAG: 3-dehydroquinate synthase [Nitrospira sp.]|nr:3-dehydroquinate synthase [Nitrospira sp.]MCP9442510.1 3-dehydroquinate synthase [Nitrospira sp.]
MARLSTVSVSLGDRSYNILIQAGLVNRCADRVHELGVRGKAAVVTDRHVGRHYLRPVLRELASCGVEAVPIVLPPGEQSKTLTTVKQVLDVLASHRFERSSFMFALGGGVVGDIAGFTAAIYQRGIPFVQIPTTLIAQSDSSVGGKTGVDHQLGKNLIGAFYQPREVWIDPLTLRTLPKREWIAGLAEVMKYGIIADEKFFSYLERHMPALLKREPALMTEAVKRSCEIKAEVVMADERESDRRRILNYGHTIGHALETLGGYRSLIHGEAVGIGMVQEADLASFLGICDRSVAERIRSVVRMAGLRDRMPVWPSTKIWRAMLHDKKVVGGQVIGVWPVAIGQVRIAPIDEPTFHRWYSEGRRDAVLSRGASKGGRPMPKSRSH